MKNYILATANDSSYAEIYIFESEADFQASRDLCGINGDFYIKIYSDKRAFLKAAIKYAKSRCTNYAPLRKNLINQLIGFKF